ncbi:PC4/YdbC family ssDNA-binding protein [Candidatus Proelusimicrobium excrementi]|uniref:PC4/YdbC family ssDNA-binding protein n=1 Tax=Candidatus Proelusimicrobium excrementi TaxID=3416222 RepID=UPI003CB126B9|nr:transcriptional coactivator p15/PC4 family protein [Elusimicrobiaceae bacterium]
MAESTFSVLNLIGALASEDGSEIKFSIDSYKGYKYVSIRKYLKSETYSGPTKAGITLSPEIVGKINTALAALPEDYKAVQEGELGKYAKKQGLSIVLRVSSYMGSKGIDLRQWQEDETYTGWTKKGIRLPIEKLKEVKELFAKTAKYFEENK